MTYQLTSDCVASTPCVERKSFAARIVNSLKRTFADELARYRRNRQSRIDRAAFRQMLSLDDELLDDIGVTCANVEWASQLPIHQSAAQALEATRKRARPRIRP